MIKIGFLLVILGLSGILIVGCSDSAFQVQVGETVDIGYGNSVYVPEADLTISFNGKVADSRCPINAYCVWAGQAEAEFTIRKGDGMPVISRAIQSPNPNLTKPAIYPGYEIRMVGLHPYPQEPGDIDLNARIATIVVSEKNNDPDVDTVHFSTLPPSDLMIDPFELAGASIDGDILTLTVRYSGGCKDHDFTLYMAPPAFLESYPVQANIYLEHQGYGDACRAYITEELQFNIRPIAEQYMGGYNQYDDIYLNVFEYFEDEPSDFLRVTYSPQ
ncbi:MAG: hypothetical protein GF310_11665 [candidate division Zixibacteria bacterium]|nr:hypothetical protein [candidate division Zixibacteria bacterium]